MSTRAEWSRRKGRSSSFVRKSLRFAIYARDGFDCVYCQACKRGLRPWRLDGVGLTLDHVKPRKEGGPSTAANMVTSCVNCNSSKVGQRITAGMGTPSFIAQLRARVRRQLAKPANRAVGLWLARFHFAHREARIMHRNAKTVSQSEACARYLDAAAGFGYPHAAYFAAEIRRGMWRPYVKR